MDNELQPSTGSMFLDRFYGFHDGLLRTVRILLSTLTWGDTVVITVSARDGHQDGDWVNVEFRLDGVSEFAFARHKADVKVMSDGVRLDWFDGLIYVDFAPWGCDEVEAIEDFCKSDFYLAARSCSWTVASYGEE
jgi:hypothetical protein